jgi:uncharacterized protein YjbI with pentapeptide repeats
MPARTSRSRSSRATQAPSFDFDDGVLADLVAGDLEMFEAGRFEGVDYAPLAVEDWNLDGGDTIDGCRFTGTTVGSWSARGAHIVESVFSGADITVASAARSGLRDIVIRDSRFGSVEAYDASWRGIRFTRCKLGFVNLRGAELLDVAFVDCTIDDIDLMGSKARRVAFDGCRVRSLNATGAALADVDLRGAIVDAVTGLEGLRGATISLEQLQLMAPALADLAGIRVDE